MNLLSIPEEFAETLDRMRYCRATKENYLSQFKIFLSFVYPKTAEEIDQSIIHWYILYLVNDRKVSLSSQNQAINAIKFYLEKEMRHLVPVIISNRLWNKKINEDNREI
jgi:integrase/recombinase XerD